MECPASMANHMQKNLGHTLSGVSTLSPGKDRFQDVYRHKARYRFWDWYRFFKENATCSFLKKRECRPLALCSRATVVAGRRRRSTNPQVLVLFTCQSWALGVMALGHSTESIPSRSARSGGRTSSGRPERDVSIHRPKVGLGIDPHMSDARDGRFKHLQT